MATKNMYYLGWLIIPAFLILLNVAAASSDFLHDILFFSIFAFSWLCFAAFVGLALHLLLRYRSFSVLPFGFGAMSIVASIVSSFINQESYAVAGFGNILQSLCTIALFVWCVVLSNQFPIFSVQVARPISISVVIAGLFWFLLSPTQFFLPVLFVPDAALAQSRAFFAACFFSAVLLTTFFCVKIADKQKHEAIMTRNSKMRRPFFIVLIALVALLLMPSLWDQIMTARILSERDYTRKFFDDALTMARAVYWADSDLESQGLASIYPRDLGITSEKAYLSYLEKHGFISAVPKTSTRMRIANLSRSDSADTIFVTSIGTMRDIHTMIHNIGGGYPNYKEGYISIRKNGKGQFYASTVPLVSTGQEPPNEPHFLEQEK